MKTASAFEIRLFELNKFILPILEMIAYHNSGVTVINLSVIEAHIMTFKALQLINWDCKLFEDTLSLYYEDKQALTISEKVFIGEVKESINSTQNY